MIRCSGRGWSARACVARARMRRHARSVEHWNMRHHPAAS